MKVSAKVQTDPNAHQVTVRTNDNSRALAIPPKSSGPGSSVNGGELLFAALATCYCNDIYREVAKRGIEVVSVDVEVEGDFDAEGESAKKVQYRAKVAAQASSEAIRALMLHTDKVAEIQNTVRVAIPVVLSDIEAVSI